MHRVSLKEQLFQSVLYHIMCNLPICFTDASNKSNLATRPCWGHRFQLRMASDRKVRTKPQPRLLWEHSLRLLPLPPLPWLCTPTWDNPWGERSKRRKPFTHLPFLLLPRNVLLARNVILLPAWSPGQEGPGCPAAACSLSEPATHRICFLPQPATVSSDPWNRQSSREIWKNHIYSQYYTSTTSSLSKQTSRWIRKSQAWFLNLAETTRKGFYWVNVMLMNPKGRTWSTWKSHTQFPIPPPQPPCSRAASTFSSGHSWKTV